MGCQSFNDAELKKLCRIHDRKAIDRAFSILMGKGMENINIDLIYGLEGQTTENALYSVREAIKLGPAHISFYMMTLYGHTVFGEMAEKGGLSLPEDSEIEKMYMEGCAALESAGYGQYEISNFSRKDRECLHNLNYWRQGEYLGVGSAAASYMDSVRRVNAPSPETYIKKIRSLTSAVETSEEITPDLLLKEHIMLRLRTVSGIDYSLFKKVFNFDFGTKYSNIIENLAGQGLATAGPGSFSLTRKGFLLSNEIIGKFF